jgi:hypothetical protein
MRLLNEGLKCNLHHKHKQWIETFPAEVDRAICELLEKDRGYMRQLAAGNTQKLVQKQNTLNTDMKQPDANGSISNGTQSTARNIK